MNEDNGVFRLTPWGCLKKVLNDYNIDCEHITGRMGEHLVEDFMDSMIRAGHVGEGERDDRW